MANVFRNDLILQRPRVSAVAKKWKVMSADGKLLKKAKPETAKMMDVSKEVGSVLQTTGQEFLCKRPKGGGRWVELDENTEGEQCWLLAVPAKLGADGAFLEDVTR